VALEWVGHPPAADRTSSCGFEEGRCSRR